MVYLVLRDMDGFALVGGDGWWCCGVLGVWLGKLEG